MIKRKKFSREKNRENIVFSKCRTTCIYNKKLLSIHRIKIKKFHVIKYLLSIHRISLLLLMNEVTRMKEGGYFCE